MKPTETAASGTSATLTPEQKRQLLQKLLLEKAGKKKIDWDEETRLDLKIDPATVQTACVAAPKVIFLTGTTGFVGAFTLRLLLDQTSAEIHCLARAEDDVAAFERIRRNLTQYGVWDDTTSHRIHAVAGDLTADRFGLSAASFDRLAAEVEVIYHIAAIVNLAYKYALLKPTNVHGARQIVRLATEGRIKPIHYLSSYAIFDSVYNMEKTFSEVDEPAFAEGLSNGYCESKWVSETLVRKARDAGVPTAIYRVGWVVGHSETGNWNKSDFIPRLIKSCVELGLTCPLGTMTMTPVDFLAKSLAYLSLREDSLGKIFHLSNGERYSSTQLFEWASEYGYAIEQVDYPTWEKAMKSSTQEISLAPMLLFLEGAADANVKMSDWFANEPKIDAQRTLEALARGGIEAPKVDRERMAIYLEHFIESGYLPPPTVVV